MKLKYWWFKQYRDYYKDETIKWLTLQEHGNDFVVLYQKLCLLGLEKQSDVLNRTIGKNTIPYTVKDFSKEFLMDSILIEKGLYILTNAGLIVQLENGSWYLPRFKEMVGGGEERTIDDHKRELARIRKRRERARKKLAEITEKGLLAPAKSNLDNLS